MTSFFIFNSIRFSDVIFWPPKTKLVIFYGLQNRYKLRHQFGRAHGFRVRANGCARRNTISDSQIHFDTTQTQAMVKILISSLKTTHEAIFQNLANTRASYLKSHFQIPVDEFEVIKK